MMADRMGLTAGLRDLRPASRRCLLTVLQLTLTPVVVLRRPLKVDAVVALSRRAPILRWRSCCLVVARGRPERGLSRDYPVAACRSQSLIMTELETYSRLDTEWTPIPLSSKARALPCCSTVNLCLAVNAKTNVKRTPFIRLWGLNSVHKRATFHMQLEFQFYLTRVGR